MQGACRIYIGGYRILMERACRIYIGGYRMLMKGLTRSDAWGTW